jgi:uncharacterized membrane protein
VVGYAREVGAEVLHVVHVNRSWMTWNLVLAFIPALLALPLFWGAHRRTAGWWMGVMVFALFLPNAPYVVTDLIHLRLDAARIGSDAALVFGVLPLYAVFIGLGLGSYLFCMEGIVREVRAVRPTAARPLIELPVHALCSLGIVLGRIARLNSWDTIARPAGTIESVFSTLTWRGAPVAFVVVFIAVWGSFTVARVLGVAVVDSSRRAITRFGAGRTPAPSVASD